MKVFIDANKYLDLLRYTQNEKNSDTVLDFLVEKHEQGIFKIVVTDQVIDEFDRNHPKLSTTKIIEQTFSAQIPSFLKESASVKRILKLKETMVKLETAIQKDYQKKISDRNSKINTKIKTIFTNALRVNATTEIMDKAWYRNLKGNPPDKTGNCIGDAISWEALLADYSDDNIILVTRDSDFLEKVEKGKKPIVNKFLEREWKSKHRKIIKVCTGFADLMELYPPAAAAEKEKIKEVKEEEDILVKKDYWDIASSFRNYNDLTNGATTVNNYGLVDTTNSLVFTANANPSNLLQPVGLGGSAIFNNSLSTNRCIRCQKVMTPLTEGIFYGLSAICASCRAETGIIGMINTKT